MNLKIFKGIDEIIKFHSSGSVSNSILPLEINWKKNPYVLNFRVFRHAFLRLI